jgi:hypothetical protein
METLVETSLETLAAQPSASQPKVQASEVVEPPQQKAAALALAQEVREGLEELEELEELTSLTCLQTAALIVAHVRCALL